MSCNTCTTCFKQADGTVIARSELDGAFVYYLTDGTRTSTAPATFTNATPVHCSLYDNQIVPTDHESHILCEVDANGDATGVRVMTITTVDPITKLPTVTRYDLATLAVWTGNANNLIVCGVDQQLESDAVAMCDNGVNFIRWTVKEKGQPTGTVYDTDLLGATYTVVGTPVIGTCSDQIVFDYEPACFKDPSNIDNLKVSGSIKYTTNKSTGITTISYIDDAGADLAMVTYKKVACC